MKAILLSVLLATTSFAQQATTSPVAGPTVLREYKGSKLDENRFLSVVMDHTAPHVGSRANEPSLKVFTDIVWTQVLEASLINGGPNDKKSFFLKIKNLDYKPGDAVAETSCVMMISQAWSESTEIADCAKKQFNLTGFKPLSEDGMSLIKGFFGSRNIANLVARGGLAGKIVVVNSSVSSIEIPMQDGSKMTAPVYSTDGVTVVGDSQIQDQFKMSFMRVNDPENKDMYYYFPNLSINFATDWGKN